MAEATTEAEPQAAPVAVNDTDTSDNGEKAVPEAPVDPAGTPEKQEKATNGADEVGKKEDGANALETREGKVETESKLEDANKDDSSKPSRQNNKYGQKKYIPGNRSRLVSQKESSDPVEIRKQVEFYFSDSNLAQDKFLFTQVGGHKNNPVPVSTIHSFKRMRHFQPFSAVVDALKESTVVDIVEEDDKPCIKRKQALAEVLQGKSQAEVQKVHESAAMARSVYVKGFGKEQATSQFDIEAFFMPYGTTNQVRLRRVDNGTFKGSVFVEFQNPDSAKIFLAMDPKPQFNGRDLLIMSKKQYCDEKVNEINAGNVRPNEPDEAYGNGHKSRRDGDDNRDWRQRRDEDRKSGFRDDRRKNGRGGRGPKHGRGGRDRHRHDDRHRDEKREDAEDVAKSSVVSEAPAAEKTETTEVDVPKPTEDVAEIKSPEPSKKRPREEEEGPDTDKPVAKKVEVTA